MHSSLLNTHLINRLSKAGAALVNTISTLDIGFSVVVIFFEKCVNPKRYLALEAKDVGSRQ